MAKYDTTIQSQQASLRTLELQVGHLADELKTWPQRKLPSDIEQSRREGKEQVQVVALRCGKPLDEKKEKSTHKKMEKSSDEEDNLAGVRKKDSPQEGIKKPTSQSNPPFKPPPSLPQRLRQKNQEIQFKKFPEMLKQLHINIPLVKALEQMSNYLYQKEKIVRI